MENPRSPLLSWPYYYQGKNMEELTQSLLYTTLELETTRLEAQEEIRKREDQLIHLQELLNRAVKERDEAQDKCKKLLLEKLLLQQQQQQLQQKKQQQLAAPSVHSGASSIEDEPTPRRGIDSYNGFSSSDCEESIVSSPVVVNDLNLPQPPQPQPLPDDVLRLLSSNKPLPEKGKLLQAVMKAGPLLQTLLLAGPLPQWKHPPPPLETFEIPLVTIPATAAGDIHPPELVHRDKYMINGSNCGAVNRKRSYLDGDWDNSSPEANKYQRVLLH